MPHGLNSGMTIVEAPGGDQRIAVQPQPVAAFIGRCLSGPLNEPVTIRGLAEFERLFGGQWAGSSMGLTLAQFFQHGGREAIIVRVANNASGGRIVLPTDGKPMRLIAVNPGSGERVRASVDYDRTDDDPHRFNLTVQRMDIKERQITDQEIHSGLSTLESDRRFVGRELESSSLIRLDLDSYDGSRPDEMRPGLSNSAIGYIAITDHGGDGSAVTDYDLIGSDRDSTGMFALQGAEHFDFLYACGDGGLAAYGPAFVFAAERFCVKRNAMLMLDPPGDATDVATLVNQRVRDGNFSASTLTYFPALTTRAGAARPLPAAGAIIGLLCRQDEQHHVWSALADDLRQNSAALHRDWKPVSVLEPDDALRLLRAGVNPLLAGMQRRLLFPGLVTCANGRDRERGSLTRQRLTKFILRRIERGTRWALFAERGESTWQRIEQQVGLFLGELAAAGAFVGDEHSSWSVRCDGATNAGDNGLRLLVAFTPRGASHPLMYAVTQNQDGTSACRTAFEYPAA